MSIGAVPSVSLCEFDSAYRDLSYRWLNDPDVAALADANPVTREAQAVWFNSLASRTDYRAWGIRFNGEAVGAGGLKRIHRTSACVWWYIGEKAYWGRGIGPEIARLVESQARNIGLRVLWGQSLSNNVRSRRLFDKQGWQCIHDANVYSIYLKDISDEG